VLRVGQFGAGLGGVIVQQVALWWVGVDIVWLLVEGIKRKLGNE